MRILLAAATPFELKEPPAGVQTVITGVGLVAATYHLQKAITEKRPDLVIQAGIAGCFDPSYALGSVIAVSEEVIADLGVEENGSFKNLADLSLARDDGRLPNPYAAKLTDLPSGRSVSVNEITTRPNRIRWYKERYDPLVESMEGAALHYVCLQENIPFLQLRAISNYIGERDKSHWRIGLALDNLNTALKKLLTHSLKNASL